jgi:hypothetical protein
MFYVDERRKYQRIERPYIVRFRVKPDESQLMTTSNWDLVAVKNMSAGGALFRYPEDLGANSNLELKIGISQSTPVINCTAKIIRVDRPQPNSMFRIVTEFTEIEEEERNMIDAAIVAAMV